MSDKHYLSKERFEEIKEELEELKTKGRKEVAQRLKKAKDMGDLSENSEYQEARNQREKLEQRITHLEEVVRNAEIIDESQDTDKVVVGSTVTIEKDGKEFTYQIVGPEEAEPSEGKISNESPMGQSLLGKKEGEEATINAAGGESTCKIIDID
ncbi:MAG: transcription elongation factor GreA [Candidatus Magasanikbacteria bacterium]